MEPIPFTKQGYDKLLEEKEQLLRDRPIAVEHLRKSRELGDLSENGYYKSSRQKLNQIDSRLRYLTHMLRYAQIIESTQSEVVELGSTVVLSDGEKQMTYTIVGGEESNPSQVTISYKSPLGKAFLGKKVSDEVILHAPSGKLMYKLTKIS